MANWYGVDSIETAELIKTPYYNIAIILMAAEGDFKHLKHFEGEEGAFRTLKQVTDYRNFLRNVDPSTYPVAINKDLKIVAPHNNVAAAILGKHRTIYYMSVGEPASSFGEDWLGDYSKKKEIIDYWSQVPEKFSLVDPPPHKPLRR